MLLEERVNCFSNLSQSSERKDYVCYISKKTGTLLSVPSAGLVFSSWIPSNVLFTSESSNSYGSKSQHFMGLSAAAAAAAAVRVILMYILHSMNFSL